MPDNDDFDGQTTDGGALRKQLEKVLADNKALTDKLNGFEVKERVRSVENALSEKGLNPKLARFVPDEDGSDPARFDLWIKDNADLFAPASANSEDSKGSDGGEPSIPGEARQAFNQIQKVSEGSSQGTVDLAALTQQVKACKNQAELNQLMASYSIT